MISNERPSPYGRRPYNSPQFSQPKPQVVEDTLRNSEIQIERKTFVFTLKENPRGRFLRITEMGGSQSQAIIIPAPGLMDFLKIVADMAVAESEIPAKKGAPC